jgi:MYXO-CTERM domain-containing protein
MRFFFLLMILAGLALGAGYTWYQYNMAGGEIGTYRVYVRGGSFKLQTVVLAQSDAPVRVFVDMVPLQGYYPTQSRTALTLTASVEGRTVLASSLSYVSSTEESKNLQTTRKVFRDRAGDLNIVTPGEYTFIIGEGDMEGLSIDTVDLVLRRNAAESDPRAMPAGAALVLLGLLGLIRAMRRRRAEGAVEAAKPKWGRDAG